MQFSIDTSGGNKKTNMLTLTPLGKQKVEALSGDGVDFMILSALAERGPCSLSEISAEVGIGKDKVRFAIKNKLIPQGFVSVVKAGGDN